LPFRRGKKMEGGGEQKASGQRRGHARKIERGGTFNFRLGKRKKPSEPPSWARSEKLWVCGGTHRSLGISGYHFLVRIKKR